MNFNEKEEFDKTTKNVDDMKKKYMAGVINKLVDQINLILKPCEDGKSVTNSGKLDYLPKEEKSNPNKAPVSNIIFFHGKTKNQWKEVKVNAKKYYANRLLEKCKMQEIINVARLLDINSGTSMKR